MVTIIGSGMGGYNFSNIDIDLNQFDKVVCDKNFESSADNVIKLGYKEAKNYILENENKNLAYIVTGSPLFFSAASTLANSLKKIKIVNNTSSLEYLLLKLGIPYQDTGVLSLHGRDEADLSELLRKKYTFLLCDKKSIEKLQKILYFVKDKIITTIGYKLGYKDEKIQEIDIYNFAFDASYPYVLLIEKKFEDKDPICYEDEFEKQNGMITKRYKRHLSLQNLDLLPNQLLWDIGAGSGSCAIEAYKRYKVRTVLFEKNPFRAKQIEQNLKNHNVIDTRLVIGNAEEEFEKQNKNPDRIFIGGGGEKVIQKLPYLYEILNKDGILLANAITLKHLSQMINTLSKAKIRYEVISLSLTTYKGDLNLAEPERELFQIKVAK
jgi:precorrin-6Y C5,15-methyltransferase (decarboxylating)